MQHSQLGPHSDISSLTEIGQCNLCRSETFTLIKSRLRNGQSRYKVYRCEACGHIQLLPKPTPEEDHEYYGKNRQDRDTGKTIDIEKLQQNSSHDTARYVRFIQSRFTTDQRLLDVGAGYGFFVEALRKAGYQNVLGVDISEERIALAPPVTAVEILNADVTNPDEPLGRFDVVTLFHVLEHMHDPIAFLRDLRRLRLVDGGTMVCEVPNVDELLLEVSEAYHDFYWIRAHLNYFGRAILLTVLEQAGFRDIEIIYQQRYGLLNLANWLMFGKPQIDHPIFEIDPPYRFVEQFYRSQLEMQGRSDSLMAVARA